MPGAGAEGASDLHPAFETSVAAYLRVVVPLPALEFADEAVVADIRKHVVGHTQRLIGKGGADSPHGQVAALLLARATRLD